jgi:hypothetical protein
MPLAHAVLLSVPIVNVLLAVRGEKMTIQVVSPQAMFSTKVTLLCLDKQGRLLNFDGDDIPDDYLPTKLEEYDPKGLTKVCNVQLVLDNEEETSVWTLVDGLRRIMAAANPGRQTTVYVGLKGIAP